MSSLAPTSQGALVPASAQYATLPAGPPSPRFDLRQVWVVLLHRALLALVVAGAVGLVVMAVALHARPVYQATASVLVEPNQSQVIKDDPAAGAAPDDNGVVDTQVEVLKTRAVAERVVNRLRLYRDPEFNPAAPNGVADDSYQPDPHTLDQVVERVAAGLDVRRVGLTYVIEVSYKASSPAKAARIANTFVEEYLAEQVQGKINANRQANGWLNSSLDKLRQDSLQADSRVQEYINAHNLMSADGQAMVEQSVTKLDDAIAAAAADTAEKQADLTTAESELKSGDGFGAGVGNDTLRDLRKAEADASRQVAELSVTFGPRYPDLVKARTQLADIRKQIAIQTDRILANLKSQVAAARQREDSLRGSFGAARGGLANSNQAQVQLIALKQQADAARKVYEAYLNRADQLAAQSGVQLPDARMASAAAPPVHPVGPKKSLAAAAALGAGAVAALAAVLLAEFLSGTMRTRSDVEQRLNVPFAGVIPDPARLRLGRRRKGSTPADLIVEKPFSSYAEAFRNIRANLQYWGDGKTTPRVIALTSALPREGKSTTALGLTRALATSGSRVILIDCDFRRSALNAMIGNPQRGLADVLEGKAKIGEVIIQDPRTSALILPWGRAPGAKEMMSTPIFDEALAALRERFDYVVLDTPPVLAVADARLIAAKADVTLMVSEWNKTPSRAAAAAVELLRTAGVNLVGVALNKVDVRLHAQYGYGDTPYAYKAVQAYHAG